MGGRGAVAGGGEVGGGGGDTVLSQTLSETRDFSIMRGEELRTALMMFEDPYQQDIETLEQEKVKVREKIDDLYKEKTRNVTEIHAFLDTHNTRGEGPEIEENMRKYEELKNVDKRLSVEIANAYDMEEAFGKRIKTIERDRAKRQRELLYVQSGKGISVNLELSESSKLYKVRWDTHIKPQKEFLESIISQTISQTPIVQIHVIGTSGSGGVSLTGKKTVNIGLESSETAPIHEFAHQIDEQFGIREMRSKKFTEFLEKQTGKSASDIEVRKWVWYVDTSGRKHYYKDTRNNEYVYIPKDVVFSTPEDETKYGYMFRIYKHQTQSRIDGEKEKRYISPLWTNRIGTEVLSKSVEHMYTEPKVFAEKFPDIFDLAVDVFRGIE